MALVGNPALRQAGAQWIQEVLEEYYKKRVTTHEVMEQSKESFLALKVTKKEEEEEEEDEERKDPDEASTSTILQSLPTLEVHILGYEVSKLKLTPSAPLPSDSSYTTLLAMKTRYVVQHGVKMIEKRKAFHVKCPPEDKDERELVEISHVNRREINFYTRLLPHVQDWIQAQSLPVRFHVHVPKCYFGRVNRSLGKTVPKDIENNFLYAESVLLLEDLEDRGFLRRDATGELSVDEVKAAIHELAKIHAGSWVMGKGGEEVRGPLGQFGQKQLESAVLYEVLLDKGFKVLKAFVQEKSSDEGELELILKRIGAVEAKLCGTLVALLEPSSPPAPTTLVHMNSWSRNLLFRPKPFEDSDPTTTTGKHRIKNSRLECQILNWEMFGRGRPTHDLGILFVTSLSTRDIRAKTDYLLQYYFQVFKDTASLFGHHLPFDLNCLRREFKESQLLGLFFMIASIDLVLAQGPTGQDRLLNILDKLIHEHIF